MAQPRKSTSSFRRLMENIGELSTITSRITRPVSDDFNELLAEEFAEEQDPYGSAWAPNAPSTIRRKGHDTIMVETGQTRDETVAYPLSGSGIELSTTEQAGYNMFKRGDGTPARPVLPSRDGLPKTWQEAIANRYAEAMRNRGSRRR